MSVAAGPIGRSAEAALGLQVAIFTYSVSQGLFAGVSLDGAVIGTRDTVNADYYDKPVAARDILAGKIEPPEGVRQLRSVLSKY